MSDHVILRGLRAASLGDYLASLGLLRVVARQQDPEAELAWHGDVPVLLSTLDATRLQDWLVAEYSPSPIVSPWNAGSGFAGNGKSRTAEERLAWAEESAEKRLAPLRKAIRVGRRVVEEGRRRGWQGGSLWQEKRKSQVIALCRARMPDDVLPWIDAAVALSGSDGLEVRFNPLAGTGGNLGRQELSATYLQRLMLLLGPKAKPQRSAAWAQQLITGAEDVAYVRDTVGQFDPGRAGGILSSPFEKNDEQGFVNPWRFLLAFEGLLLFASAVVRRNSGSRFGALPFVTRSTPLGYATAAERETTKGELWAPLWSGCQSLPQLEHLMGEGRASFRGGQAVDGLDFVLAVASLGVDRQITGFRRFLFVERLGLNPIAVHAGDVPVVARPELRLLHEPYAWLGRLRGKRLPSQVHSLLRRTEAAVFRVATGGGDEAVTAFVRLFGMLHENVARSGTVRRDVPPFQPRTLPTWSPKTAWCPPELRLAAAFAGLSDRAPFPNGPHRSALRPLLTRVRAADKAVLRWADRPATAVDLQGSTLARCLAAAHRLHGRSATEQHLRTGTSAQDTAPAAEFPHGPVVGWDVAQGMVDAAWDDELTADLLRGLLTLGWYVEPAVSPAGEPAHGGEPTEPADPSGPRAPVLRGQPDPALATLLPFFGSTLPRVYDTWAVSGDTSSPARPREELRPRGDWIARLAGGSVAPVLADARLRLEQAGCHPVHTTDPDEHLRYDAEDGERLAAALLLRVRRKDRALALTAVTATRMPYRKKHQTPATPDTTAPTTVRTTHP